MHTFDQVQENLSDPGTTFTGQAFGLLSVQRCGYLLFSVAFRGATIEAEGDATREGGLG